MRSLRSRTAIAVVGASIAVPGVASAAGSATSTSSQITPTAPARLTATSDAPSAHAPAGPLPNTGYDLLPETVIGLGLVGAGVGLRLVRARF